LGRLGLGGLILADERRWIARLRAQGNQIVFYTHAHAREILAQAGVIEMVAGAVHRRGLRRAFGQTVDEIELADERRQPFMLGRFVGASGQSRSGEQRHANQDETTEREHRVLRKTGDVMLTHVPTKYRNKYGMPGARIICF
jgi:hypothetical protein